MLYLWLLLSLDQCFSSISIRITWDGAPGWLSGLSLSICLLFWSWSQGPESPMSSSLFGGDSASRSPSASTHTLCALSLSLSYERHTERGRHRQREKQSPHGEPDVGLNPKTSDHDLSQRQMLNHWASQVPQINKIFIKKITREAVKNIVVSREIGSVDRGKSPWIRILKTFQDILIQ